MRETVCSPQYGWLMQSFGDLNKISDSHPFSRGCPQHECVWLWTGISIALRVCSLLSADLQTCQTVWYHELMYMCCGGVSVCRR